MSAMQPLVLSLFPGVGLLDMAFELEGFCVVRGPDVLWGGDIRRFHPPGRGRFDGVIGGPPCQAFSSLAHLVRANGCEPKFGNLIPEFERCVCESEAAWFLMENVPQAPEPTVAHYAARSFIVNNAWLPGDDGLGQEQERKRRFTFGLRGGEPVNLMRYIRLLIGGSGKCKRTVTTSTGGPALRMSRYTFAEACRLQGLPEDFLADAPFTAAGKLKAVANGVPLPMGRAIARAVRRAIGLDEAGDEESENAR